MRSWQREKTIYHDLIQNLPPVSYQDLLRIKLDMHKRIVSCPKRMHRESLSDYSLRRARDSQIRNRFLDAVERQIKAFKWEIERECYDRGEL